MKPLYLVVKLFGKPSPKIVDGVLSGNRTVEEDEEFGRRWIAGFEVVGYEKCEVMVGMNGVLHRAHYDVDVRAVIRTNELGGVVRSQTEYFRHIAQDGRR